MNSRFFYSLILGLLIGGSTVLYFKGLQAILSLQLQDHRYPYLLIVVFILISVLKKRTLYFPTKVQQVISADQADYKSWSSLAYLWNILGSWLSHFAGASLGREGTSIVLSSGLVKVFRLDWSYYQPLVISTAFSTVVHQPLVGLIFMIEIFRTTFEQKIFVLFMSWLSCLVLSSFGLHFFELPVVSEMQITFFNQIKLVVLLGIVIGVIASFHKNISKQLTSFLNRYQWMNYLILLGLTMYFLTPESIKLHSLSLESFSLITMGQFDLIFLILKYLMTILFISLGFIGGEFVPSIIIGTGVGGLVAQSLGIDFRYGIALGFLSYFHGLTRLKWTCVWIVFLYFNFSTAIWAYICFSIINSFSGMNSIYKNNKVYL